ncbi:Detected protein of unknown function [Hibiscus syriacus]|uniref:Uncharacterized protein n=1 Tax=Hibiscus syriacus TaxID=106335 RepID=A0A6A3D2A9_HIBSY|nr:uncharacterized protein LOC120204449 [Hibiscus syriacus]KAE8735740.1 Detected protein of unknown function [Hibiscus syriacus]
MQNYDNEKQDQRLTCNMEDSNMTIEFLRARLLSERSVSKSARQRADELARRVAELEEQLRIVSVQRRRAEKETADVLSILENNGVSDVSEELDSNSEKDTPFASNMYNVSTKEEEGSVSSKVRRKVSEEHSGSDDLSSVSGRSLSWKGRKSASHSPEQYKDSLVRRQNSFSSMGFSPPKHRQGKSCRQIRRRESRLVAEKPKSDDVKADPPVNGLITSPEVSTNHSESEKDMEKALEHQAQLIDRYEAMERTQREWEEKFRENNSSTPDSCDPGNNSDVTEERDEVKTQTHYASGKGSLRVQVTEGEHSFFSTELPKTQSHDHVPPSHGDMDQLQDHNCGSSLYPTSLNQTSPGPMAKENHNQESLQRNHSPIHSSHAHASRGDQTVPLLTSDMSGSSTTEPLGNKNEIYALVPHETPSRFTDVLDALKQARMSLQQKINKSPLIVGGSGGKAIEPSVYGRKVRERVEIPVGCSGLFRVPTDFSAEASKMNFLSSGLLSSLTSYYPDAGIAPTSSNHLLTTSYTNTRSSSSSSYPPVTSDRFYSSPYMDVRSSFSTVPTASAYINDDQILTSRYAETGSRSIQNPRFDPYLEPGPPSSALQSYPAFPSYSDLVPQIRSREGFPVFPTTRLTGVRPDQFSFYDNHFRPDTHRL